MAKNYISDQDFDQTDSIETTIGQGEYENCTFTNCNFTACNLSEYIFSECTFDSCDLSNSKTVNTSFREVKFINCKLLGVHFDECNPFLIGFSFQNCILNFSSFYKLKLKGIVFDTCKLEEVDFSGADLALGIFKECELLNATFDQTGLEGADMRTARNFAIDPERNRIKKAKFSRNSLSGLLGKYNLKIE